MRKFLFVALAVVATACSDPIAYEGTPEPPPCPIGGCVNSVVALSPSNSASITVNGAASVGAFSLYAVPLAPSLLSFTGLLDKDNSVTVSPIGSLSSTVGHQLAFDMYVFGSWDGAAKQAQHGAFTGPSDNFKTSGDGIQVSCGAGTDVIYATTFSNQKTVSQHYPEQVGPKTTKAGSDALNYGDLGITVNWANTTFNQNFEAWVPLFQSVPNSRYHLVVYVPAGCVHPLITVSLDQPVTDEAWGIGNVSLQ